MGRGKVQMKMIENPVHRQVSFCKRRAGLFKKAKELSVLCDAEIGIMVYSANGKLYELATNGNMKGLIERYMKSKQGQEIASSETNQLKAKQPLESEEDIVVLKQEIQLLQNGLRYILKGGAGYMTFNELDVLEKHLESWIHHIRSLKMVTLFQEIELLKNKEGILRAANECLKQKVEEQRGIFDLPPVTTEIPHEPTKNPMN